MRAMLALILLAGLTGCGTVGGWLGMSGTAPVTKPVELGEIKASLTMVRAWEVAVGAGKGHVFSPATDGQAAYAASAGGVVVKVDLASGREVWRVDAQRPLSAGVGAGEGLVLVGTPEGELLAFRADNGQAAWSARLSGEVLTPPVALAGMVAARGNDGKVWLFDAVTGKQRWVYGRALPSLILREPGDLLLTGRALFAGFPGGKLTALSLVNGAPLWEANVALPKGATELERISDVAGALAADDDLICASAYQGRVACFSQTTGQPVWARDFSGTTGVGMGERFLFVADERGAVMGYDKTRGASLWRQEALRDRGLSTPLVLNRTVAVADYQGVVHLLGIEDGAFVARAATDGSSVSGRMLALNGGLVAQTSNGALFAFKIQ